MSTPMKSSMTPQEIVSELDRHIVGQSNAKRAVAIALRNRWRRQQVDEKLRGEITPKNILMIGPTGVGKTEIARRLARLTDAPFLKIEASKFTEVGYVGRDVESIVRDLTESAVDLVRAAIELTKDWRTDRVLRRLEAMLAVADKDASLIITGNGDVLEPERGIVAIGSGGSYAQAAAQALLAHTDMAPKDIVKRSLEIAGELCIYTNQNHSIETLD